MADRETIHVADVSEGIGGDATTNFQPFHTCEVLYKIP